MRYGNFINRRWRRRWRAVTAGLSLAVWLVMTAAEVCPSLHAWLHGGAIPDHDHCAVVAIAHGKVETAVVHPPPVVPVTAIEIISLPEFFVFRPASAFLPNGRAPPVPSFIA